MSNDIFILVIFVIVFSIAFLIIVAASGSGRKTTIHGNLWASREEIKSPYLGFYKEVLHGDQEDHYLKTFLSLDGIINYRRSWNWPASIFSLLWLVYRGMLGTAAVMALIILATIFMAPITITLAIVGIFSLLLGAMGSRYYHYLVKRDIDILLATNTPSHAIKSVLHQRWDSRISIGDMVIAIVAIILVGTVYVYRFDDARLAAELRKLYSKLPEVSPPDLSSQLKIDAKYSIEDIKSVFRQALHKESVAALLLSKIKIEHHPARQKGIFLAINAAALEQSPLAQFAMGMIYGNGYLNVFKDIKLAIYWYRQSASHGNVDAKIELGKIYLLDDIEVHNPRESESWLKQATDQGSTVARDILKEQLENKLNTRPPDKTAIRLISQSGKGDSGARLALLKAVREERDAKKQRTLFSELVDAATTNNASAEYLLGLCYQYGYLGLPRNTVSAISWYKQSALHDNVEAQVELGKLYSNGGADIQDPAEAEFWLKQAADQGAAIAQDMLKLNRDAQGKINGKDRSQSDLIARAGKGDNAAKIALLQSIAEEKDPQMQQSLIIGLTDAAMANNALAAYFLGMSYRNGYLGLDNNNASAIAWLKESAKHGSLDAQLELGKLYLPGGSATENLPEAQFWLKQAADQGSTSARELLGSHFQEGSSPDQHRHQK